MKIRNLKHSGFTLVELVIVVAILGLLVSVAVPSYQQYITRANRADAKDKLAEVMFQMERFATRNRTYTLDMTALGFDADPAISTEGFYSVDSALCPGATEITNCVLVTATPVAGEVQAGDGNLSIDSRGERLPADKWRK